MAEKTLAKPKQIKIIEAVPKKAPIGKLFKTDGNKVISAILMLTELQIDEIEKAWNQLK